MSPSPRPVLITGCSSGIGRSTAEFLVSHGMCVYATARSVSTLAALAERGATVRPLDVTDEESMVRVVEEIVDRHGSVWALVNNAGYGEYGPVETVDVAAARRQFETNFFGLARMCQLVLPGMRSAGGGRIVNMSSVGGRLTFPGGGFYSASKFAVEALSDALRFETGPIGVQVSVVEPNLVRGTRFDDGIHESLLRNAGAGQYDDLSRAMLDQLRMCFASSRMSTAPEAVARTVHRALTAPRPRSRYVVSANGRFLITMRRLLTDRSLDATLRRQFGLTAEGRYTGSGPSARETCSGAVTR